MRQPVFLFWAFLATAIGLCACQGGDGGGSLKDTDTLTETDSSTEDAPDVDTEVASPEDVRSFLGGRGGVLAYVDSGGRVQILDYREAAPAAGPLTNDPDCVNPIVSRDGTRVVYSQGPASGPKIIKVADIATGESAVVATGDLGYWAVRGDEELIVYCDWSDKARNGADGKTYEVALVAGSVEVAGTPVVIHGSAMDAGPSGDLRWLGQVYNNVSAYNTQTKVEYPTDKFALLDGSAADHQTCNGSMSPDDSGAIMLLAIPHDFIRIFTYASEADRFEETSEINLPGNMAEWEYPEWSTHPGYFTAVLRGSDLKNSIYLVRIEGGSSVPDAVKLVDDDHASYSHLWIEP